MMKMTFYGHFVAGEDKHGIRPNVEKLMYHGINSIIQYSAEEDIANENIKESSELISLITTKFFFDPSEKKFEKNKIRFEECIDVVSGIKIFYSLFSSLLQEPYN